MVRRTSSCLSLVIVAATLSCGGKSSTTCVQTTPCGGNLVGTWDITASCATGAPVKPDTSCPGETISVSLLNDTGSFTFNSDGTYTVMVSASGQETATVPLSCLSAGGAPASCNELTMALNGLSAADGGVALMTSATCTQAGSNCDCNATISFSGLNGTGTYSVSGTGVTVTPSGGTPTTDEYCVQGSSLSLQSGVGAPMMGMPPAADLVLTKR